MKLVIIWMIRITFLLIHSNCLCLTYVFLEMVVHCWRWRPPSFILGAGCSKPAGGCGGLEVGVGAQDQVLPVINSCCHARTPRTLLEGEQLQQGDPGDRGGGEGLIERGEPGHKEEGGEAR